ncbi:hypothetical protein DCCM_4743 [Desulfocucumis palustris]|uniref:Copper amine oxidase-like N-terminal domain-containing protein n=1 Tax=Desulfocucumis palustris TaxID=1898651 RepID=A0A2L2XI10_9FIRM|nr:stalk domain-containing protein [Desulfocucumis palustris]GBF35614.1 hypothetical protein DCCM_4743 [Desulfocucumis palustris]
MKRTLPVFMAGILAGALLFGGIMAAASDGSKNIPVEYSGIKIIVNGKLLSSQLEPFTYDDKVFVPLRSVAEALQQQVGWEDNTVIITGGNAPRSLSLQDLFMPSCYGLKISENSKMLVDEKEYNKGFYVIPTNKDKAECKFTTSFSGLKKITGTLALDDESKNKGLTTLTIFIDGKKSQKIEIGPGPAVPLEIDATGANDITFQVENAVDMKIDFIDMKLNY